MIRNVCRITFLRTFGVLLLISFAITLSNFIIFDSSISHADEDDWKNELIKVVLNLNQYSQLKGEPGERVKGLVSRYSELTSVYKGISWVGYRQLPPLNATYWSDLLDLHFKIVPKEAAYWPRQDAARNFQNYVGRYYPDIPKDSQAYWILKSLSEAEEEFGIFMSNYSGYLLNKLQTEQRRQFQPQMHRAALPGFYPKVEWHGCKACAIRNENGLVMKNGAAHPQGPPWQDWEEALNREIAKFGLSRDIRFKWGGCVKNCTNRMWVNSDPSPDQSQPSMIQIDETPTYVRTIIQNLPSGVICSSLMKLE